METWKEFDANEVTHSVVHHLMTIHELGQQYGGWARVSDIARHLSITRGSVSINLRTNQPRCRQWNVCAALMAPAPIRSPARFAKTTASSKNWLLRTDSMKKSTHPDVVEDLNRLMAEELEAYLRYFQLRHRLRGTDLLVAGVFLEKAMEETQQHASAIAKHIRLLGKTPH